MAETKSRVPTAVGLDVGYGVVKAMSIEPESHRRIEFPSAVCEAPKDTNGPLSVKPNFTEGRRRYLVGERAVQHGTLPDRSIDSSYIMSNEYRVQALHAINQITGPGEPIVLVTGLPMEFVASHRKKLSEEIKQWKLPGKREIAEVQVVPQPLGTLFDVSVDWKGKPTADFAGHSALIDIGRGTIDAMEVRNGQPTPGKAGGRSWGVHTMHDELRNELNKKYPDQKFPPQQIDEIFRARKFTRWGESMDVSKDVDRIRKQFMTRIDSFIREVWAEETASLARVIFTGGGAAAVADLLQEGGKSFHKKQVLLPEEPVMSNAMGFSKIAFLSAQKLRRKAASA